MMYEPREDSFLIEKQVVKFATDKSCLDLGTGSGILGKAALSAKAKSVVFGDVNPEVIDRLKRQGLNAVETNLFSNIDGKFDLIIFNPPYLPADKRESAESALATTGGKKGDELICRFLKQVKKHLEKDGKILLLVSSLTPMKSINSICKKEKLSINLLSNHKLSFEELFVYLIER